jgi:hypothetical protein
MKTLTKVLLLLILPFFITAQNADIDNQDRCCDDAVVIPNNTKGTLGDATVWYTPKMMNESNTSTATHRKVFNPLAMLSARSASIEVSIHSEDGVLVKTLDAKLMNGELILPKMRLNNGSYYVQIVDDNNTYRSGITIE